MHKFASNMISSICIIFMFISLPNDNKPGNILWVSPHVDAPYEQSNSMFRSHMVAFEEGMFGSRSKYAQFGNAFMPIAAF